MSDTQAKIQMDVFKRQKPVTREEAIAILFRIGVMNMDGSLTDDYQFMQAKK